MLWGISRLKKGEYSHYTQTEGDNGRNSLTSIELQAHDHWERHNPDDHVRENHACTGHQVWNNLFPVTDASIPVVPVVDWAALEQCISHGCDCGGNSKGEGSPNRPFEVADG